MKVSTYLRGQTVRLATEVRNSAGVLADPTSLTVVVRKPDNTSVTFTYPADAEVVRTAQGLFRFDFTTALAGRHYVRWTSVEPGDAQELQFMVSPGEFAV